MTTQHGSEETTARAETVRTAISADGARVRIVFSHPKGNILTAALIAGLRAALADLQDARGVKLLMLEGAGDDFSFGASIEEHTPFEIARVLPETHRLIADLLDAPMPTAAIVRGRCLGGGLELALACDVIFASEEASLGLPEIALGGFPPAASVLLPARIGASRAAVPVLSGEIRPAADWHADGVVYRTAPSSQLARAVDDWYQRSLAGHSASALRHAAAAIRRDLRDRVHRLLPQAERLYLDSLMQTHDAVEGVAAFLEKRPPIWRDT